MPIPVWLFYLLDHNDRIPSKVLGVMLTAAYMVFKGKAILGTSLAWKSAATKLLQSTVSKNLKKKSLSYRVFKTNYFDFRDTEKVQATMKSRPLEVHVPFVMIIFANQLNYIANTYFAKNVFQLGSIGKPRVQCVELR